MLIKAIWFDYNYDTTSDKNWQEQIVEYAASKGVVELFTDYNTDATRGWVFQVADTTIRKDKEIKAQLKQKEDKLYTDEAM
jgi:flagella basal body P-ring formation protein FlgA